MGIICRVDAITREIILKLTTKVSDLEAAVEAHRVMLKELAQECAAVSGKTFNAAAHDLQLAEAGSQHREKMALAVEPEVVAPTPAPLVLDLPEVEQE